MGWTGPYSVLCPKRPTASLVSRKVLTPLLGQIVLAFFLQFICYKAVKRQSWYIPPVINEDKSNIINSENTTLFLVSCYQYVFAGVVLSVGPPYRQRMQNNRSCTFTPSHGAFLTLCSPIRHYSNGCVTLRYLSSREPNWLAFQIDAAHRDLNLFQIFFSRHSSSRVFSIIVFGAVHTAAACQDHRESEVSVEAEE